MLLAQYLWYWLAGWDVGRGAGPLALPVQALHQHQYSSRSTAGVTWDTREKHWPNMMVIPATQYSTDSAPASLTSLAPPLCKRGKNIRSVTNL